jgi:hypothetical protein
MAQTEANRRNALQSTGPKTSAGKAKSSKNALRHGAFSLLPVVEGMELTEDWESHRSGILASLSPNGALETALAERVALCLWRLDRVRRFETAVTGGGLEGVDEKCQPRHVSSHEMLRQELDGNTDGPPEHRLAVALEALKEKQEKVELWAGAHRLLETLQELPDCNSIDGDDLDGLLSDLNDEITDEDKLFDVNDPEFLAGLGVPEEHHDDAFDWDGWTAGMARKAVAAMAEALKRSPDALMADALEERREVQECGAAEVEKLEAQVKRLRREIKLKAERMKRERILPDDDTLQKVTRYESHLSRQMYQALHELQRLQARRTGERIAPPAALDVTLNGNGSEPSCA